MDESVLKRFSGYSARTALKCGQTTARQSRFPRRTKWLRGMAVVLMSAWCFCMCQHAAAQTPSQEATSIRHLLHSMYDKPGSNLVLDPVVIQGDVAIVGWTQGEMGGRAFLRQKNGEWVLVLCSGDGIKSAAALETLGLTKAEAAALLGSLAEAESRINPRRRAMFSHFSGTILMDTASH